MKILFTLTVVCCLYSCSTLKPIMDSSNSDLTNSKDTSKTVKMEVNLKVHIPYCGGIVPTEEMLNTFAPESNKDFVLTRLDKSYRNLIFKTDSLGMAYLELVPGRYGIKRAEFFNTDFESFYKKYSNTNIEGKDRGKECYKKWFEAYLVEFEVSYNSNRKINVTIQEYCFTGQNPCIIYEGPMPP